jgi:hypothetical protein
MQISSPALPLLARAHALSVWFVHGAVQTVRSVINPDKLHRLGPVADVRGLMHEQDDIEGSA